MRDIEYFINKFNDIPEEYFSLSTEVNPTDVWEWCDPSESEDLYSIARRFGVMLMANDGDEDYLQFGDNPKQRVVNFLLHIKNTRSPYLYY